MNLQSHARMRTLISPSLIKRPTGQRHDDHEHCRSYQLCALPPACQSEPNGISQSSGKVTPIPRRRTRAHTHTPQMICLNPSSSVTIKGPMERSAREKGEERRREKEGREIGYEKLFSLSLFKAF